MRRLVVVAVLAVATLGLAPSAIAASPTHDRSVFTEEYTYPAGTLCDFDYHQSVTVKQNFFIYGDPAAPTKIVWQSVQDVTHTNLKTGYTLTETAAVAETFYPDTAIDKVVGIFWHLRDANGRLVVVHAGQMILDYTDFPSYSVVKLTPLMDPSFDRVLCTALGGNLA